jgi:hypothetical protein
MTHIRSAAVIGAIVLLALPALASAQVYYYAPNTTSGAYNYDSYIPQAAMPYVQMGYQMQQQQQYQGYSYPSSYQYQSQSQSQYSYPSYEYGYSEPTYENSYNYEPSYNYSNEYTEGGEYTSEPRSVSYPSGTTGPFGTQLCYWSDYPTYAPCNQDPQQWIQDPYTGDWY